MFPVKTASDGKAYLNLGCGARTHSEWNNVDFSAYARLANRPGLVKVLRAVRVLPRHRYEALQTLDREIRYWDLRKGVPYPDGAFDAVYHSHFLEHLDKDAAERMLGECHRVLKRGGILRIVIPDLGEIIARYVAARAQLAAGDESAAGRHEQANFDLFDQMVRDEPGGISRRPPGVRQIERLLRGDTRRTGEAHRWMYDADSLSRVLRRLGFRHPKSHPHQSSDIPGWERFHLDVDPDGAVHKPGSLYLEAIR
jgi:SAM-dependent methyltransferase